MKKKSASRKMIFVTSLLVLFCIGTVSVAADTTSPSYNVNRLAGSGRCETAIKIAEQYNSGTLQNVVLSTAYDFPDALGGSVYAAKIGAPILLIGKNVSESQKTLDYIESKLDKSSGTIHIFGGTGVVSEDILNYLRAKGYTNFVILGGEDRFQTNRIITEKLNVTKGTPVVLVTANDFPDALSISSIAAIKGYPIIISDKAKLSPTASTLISTIQPSDVYIIGGEGVLSKQVVTDLKGILPNAIDDNLKRMGGANRYETSLKICTFFNLNSTSCVLTTGNDFPDGITGATLAAKLNAPILLIDEANLNNQTTYISNNNITDIFILGGPGAVSTNIEQGFLKVSIGFDCASARTFAEAKTLKDAGYSFAARYYCKSNPGSWKNNLTLSEAKDISRAGLKIVVVYEYGGKDNPSYFTYAQGVIDCKIAISNAKEVGQPTDSAIYFAIDSDTSGDFKTISSYFDGIKDTMKADVNNKWKIGVYGGYNEVNYIYNKLGPDTYVWQTPAWSNGKLIPTYNIYQYQNNLYISGINIDNDKANLARCNDIGGFTIP